MSNNDYKGQLEKVGVLAFVPGGNSMWPTLKDGGQSVIIVKKEERLKVYDVGFYVRNERYILHRVVKVLENGYIFVGDSQGTEEFVLEDNVFGVMKAFYRGEKYIDVENADYKAEIEKLYKNNKARIRRAKFHFIKKSLKRKFIKLITFRWKRG